MFYFIWTLVFRLCLALLSLRYRVRVHGLDTLKKIPTKKGILFLPNHPAHMDPLFLFLYLWPRYRMRPLVIEYVYRLPFLKSVMRLVGALPVPNFETSVNQLKVRKAERSLEAIAEGLKRGEHFVLYPGGRLKATGKEILAGASAAHALVQECPEAHIVLVRTRGLWGSSFSRSILGRSPDLWKTILHGIKTLLKNGIFFCPRRTVEIDIDPFVEVPKESPRLEFNRFLEDWYNRYPKGSKTVKTEPLQQISYSFWKKDVPEPFEHKRKRKDVEEMEISQETKEKVEGEIRRILENSNLKIDPEMHLALDLGMDSLNVAEFIAFLLKSYDIEELHAEDVETVQSALEVAEGAKATEHPIKHQTGKAHFPEEKNRPEPTLPIGDTFFEAFLYSCERMGSYAACADDLVGILSYKKLKRAVLVLSSYFRKREETHIAILLPASVGAYLLTLAVQFAGKVPVMLNWTLGPRYLEEMMRSSGAKQVITSWRFLERLSHVEFGSLIDQIVLLEDIRASLTLSQKLGGLFLSMKSPKAILKKLDLDKKSPDDPCVILFTSGTESIPKGVPLSHKNILSNQRAAMQCISLTGEDVAYGILPPFHSFGFSVAGLLPIFIGMRVAFYPDPTDALSLAEGIERWKIRLFCSPPSFLKGLFATAKPEQIAGVRLFVTGAEKAPKELYERVESLGPECKMLEGYGITECSPILTITRPNMPPKGVGHLLPEIELRTIHPETLDPLEEGEEGEICVRGPNVFHGYLGSPRSPFIEIEGKYWYRTGDIGYLDAEGYLILSGRLKRFAKIGGEMISLGAIEETVSQKLIEQKRISTDIPSLALCANEKVLGKAQLILFATIDLTREEVNELLREAGFSRLVKISSIEKIDQIPLLGTGKTNYRALQEKI